VSARVRLIIILGDGFPNDLAYKGTYAVEDTRRAVMEARAAAIHVKAITVNANDNGQLDRLYGPAHHTRIGDVRELPDRLVRVYSALTRN
jgi:nitric oxide reductase activation protein